MRFLIAKSNLAIGFWIFAVVLSSLLVVDVSVLVVLLLLLLLVPSFNVGVLVVVAFVLMQLCSLNQTLGGLGGVTRLFLFLSMSSFPLSLIELVLLLIVVSLLLLLLLVVVVAIVVVVVLIREG